jgi:hypothetical protein
MNQPNKRKEKISKICLEHIVKGLNCSTSSNLKVIENKDGIFIIDEKDSEDIKNKLHLKINQDNNELKISIANYNTQFENEYKKLFDKSLLFSSKVVNKVFELVTSDDTLCTSISMITEAVCKFITLTIKK